MTTAVLAEHLDADVVDFPGGCIGYRTNPSEFARVPTGILRQS